MKTRNKSKSAPRKKIAENYLKYRDYLVNLFNNEENFTMLLILMLLNIVLFEGGSILATFPWIIVTTFLLKLRYKNSKKITIHTIGSVILIGIATNDATTTAYLIISEAVCLYAGFMLSRLTNDLLSKDKPIAIKITKCIFELILIFIAVFINMSQYGSTSEYLKASNMLNNYVKENYEGLMYKGRVYHIPSFSNSLYYIEISNKENQKKYKVYINRESQIKDEYINNQKEEIRQDLISTITVLSNENKKLNNFDKANIKLLFNNDNVLIDKYDSSINLEIVLNDKYENITEFNNYAFTLLKELKALDLNYNVVEIKSYLDDSKSYYNVSVLNKNFPTNLIELEKISFLMTKEID